MTSSLTTGVPTYDQLMLPIIKALDALGGAAPNRQIIERAIADGAYTEDQQAELLPSGTKTRLHDRLEWALWHLARAGILDRPSRGVCALTDRAKAFRQEDVRGVVALVHGLSKRSVVVAAEPTIQSVGDDLSAPDDNTEESSSWRDVLLGVLQAMPPSAFERLCQRLLRESGFTKVEVTGKSGDGGIDGTGVLRLGLLSFQVFFQCKRYKGVVGAQEVRNFRGAMVGRSDKGLFITTGSYTTAASHEAARDGAPPIDLIDGAQLCDLLNERGIGVRPVTRIEIDAAFFDSL